MAELTEGSLVRLRTGELAIVGYIQHDTGTVFVRELNIRGNVLVECGMNGVDRDGRKAVFLFEEWDALPIGAMTGREDGFYPGCPVLVQCRDLRTNARIWRMAHLSHITPSGDFVLTHGSCRRKGQPILPYHGNEYLLGTEVRDGFGV